jgi:hypothetical protein
VFQIIVKTLDLSINNIRSLMPTGWTVEQTQYGLLINNSMSGLNAGVIHLGDQQFTINAMRNSEDQVAIDFWHSFGMKHHELNPFDLRFGVVYKAGSDENDWELDEYPAHGPQEVLEDVLRYAKANMAYYVSFFLGDWHYQEQLKTKSCQPILANGLLGKDKGVMIFGLGSIENPDTM